MFNGGLPQSFGHPVTRKLESNCTLKMFELQSPHHIKLVSGQTIRHCHNTEQPNSVYIYTANIQRLRICQFRVYKMLNPKQTILFCSVLYFPKLKKTQTMAIIWESANWIFNPLTVTVPNKRKPFMGDKRKFVMKLVALQCMVKSLPKIYFGGDFSLSLHPFLSFPYRFCPFPSLSFFSFPSLSICHETAFLSSWRIWGAL